MFGNVRRHGFTLPEILVTVTVIAVLAAAVVPVAVQYVNKGNTPSSQQDIDQLRTGITAFATDIRHYPGDLLQLVQPINAILGGPPQLNNDGGAVPVMYTPVDVARWKGPYTAAPITTVGAAGMFTSAGLAFTIGHTLSLVNNWLTVPVTVPGSTAADCPAILALDKALDGAPAVAGTEGTTGIVIWTSGAPACAAATVGTAAAVTNFKLRLVPAT
jgi:prepilin-type N-terminal cleavage/methylation domain-containing protein